MSWRTKRQTIRPELSATSRLTKGSPDRSCDTWGADRVVTHETMHATCELDLTDFGDADTFRSLLEKHGLRYDGIRINGHTPAHSWVSFEKENIQLFTQCNPIDGDHIDPRAGDRNPGYASYITISGDISLARSALRDVLRDAEYVKGVIQQLMTDDGTVVYVTEE